MQDQDTFQTHQWMADSPLLDKLSLFEMTLPGAHNAGCDWEASYALIPGKNWLACQDVSFYSQLNRGARALDLRLIYNSEANHLGRFRFHHNGYTSSRTLEDLVRDLKGFQERSRNEFIVLDFHELSSVNDPFNHAQFKSALLEQLGERIIPSENLHLTLGQLKAINPLQRIMVAAPMTWETQESRFESPIQHKWIGQTQVNTTDLHGYIKGVLSNPVSTRRPWSLSATSFTLGGPQRILDSLDEWFDPGKTDWARKCNIINFDFIKNSNIVRFCQMANLQKAHDKPS